MPKPNPRHPKFPIPGGPELRAKGWRQEALLRLLENVLAVGEDPDNLVVYAALGKAARNWAAHKGIVKALTEMEEDQTLLIQSGKPIGVVKTHVKAPLVIMANCNIVGQWARAEVFYELQRKGLICWGGLTAGAWQYIGSQGVIRERTKSSCALPSGVSAATSSAASYSPPVLAAWEGLNRLLAAWRALQSSASISIRSGQRSVSKSAICRRLHLISMPRYK
ncbi:hypothetical protein AJ87_03930 [Rhizobium yanglingense]|nr:hypothetical protein AJ87_03930 [Rhizobium yanglingense]